jgi:hypothetical protein
MTRNIKLDRRGILIVGGIAAAGVATYGVAGIIGVARRCREFAAASEAAAQSARRIGLAYLRVYPEEASEADLLEAVVSGRPARMHALSVAPDTAAPPSCVLILQPARLSNAVDGSSLNRRRARPRSLSCGPRGSFKSGAGSEFPCRLGGHGFDGLLLGHRQLLRVREAAPNSLL